MPHVLFVTTDKTTLAQLSLGMDLPDGALHWASTGNQALAMLKNRPVDLVVADERLGDMTGLAFVEKLVKVNPMINCATVSALSKSDYHEASEGLGILLQLPVGPNRADGKALMAVLEKILGVTTAAGDRQGG